MAAARLSGVTDRGLEALRSKWFENLERAEPQQMKTMAEAYILIRQMQTEDAMEKDKDPFLRDVL